MAIEVHKLYKNVRCLAEHRNIPIYILEENLGVELGYFARKENKELIPPLGTVEKISEITNCPMDTIMYSDISKFSDDDFYINDFFQKLQAETEVGTVSWEKTEDERYTTKILPDKTLFLSGVLKNGAWGNLRLWMEDEEQVSSEEAASSATKEDKTATEPDNSEDAASPSDGNSTENKKQYVIYDIKRSYNNSRVDKHARSFAVAVKASIDHLLDAETKELVKEYLTGTETESAEQKESV